MIASDPLNYLVCFISSTDSSNYFNRVSGNTLNTLGFFLVYLNFCVIHNNTSITHLLFNTSKGYPQFFAKQKRQKLLFSTLNVWLLSLVTFFNNRHRSFCYVVGAGSGVASSPPASASPSGVFGSSSIWFVLLIKYKRGLILTASIKSMVTYHRNILRAYKHTLL